MDYNLLNGGLVLKENNKLIISDIKNLTTVYGSAFEAKTEGMFWFMNFDGNSVFYSDQKRHHALCRMDFQNQREEFVVSAKPCYGLCLKQDWLYYINENDRKVYYCLTNGKSETKLIDEQVESFILEAGKIYYTTSQGIWTCSERGTEKEAVNDVAASTLLLLGEKLVFTDKHKQHLLIILDLHTNSTEIVDGMAVSSMNTDGRYLYCTNRLNDNSIYRIDPEQGNSIRICGESAEYLHVIENELYFCIEREWYKMSLDGGKPRKIMR